MNASWSSCERTHCLFSMTYYVTLLTGSVRKGCKHHSLWHVGMTQATRNSLDDDWHIKNSGPHLRTFLFCYPKCVLHVRMVNLPTWEWVLKLGHFRVKQKHVFVGTQDTKIWQTWTNWWLVVTVTIRLNTKCHTKRRWLKFSAQKVQEAVCSINFWQHPFGHRYSNVSIAIRITPLYYLSNYYQDDNLCRNGIRSHSEIFQLHQI